MKPLRIVLAVFFSVLAVSAAVLVILFLRTDPEKVFRMFSEQIEQGVSLRVVAGGVKMDLLKGIELSNVLVIDRTSGKSNMLATFEHGRILYNPFALLWSKVDIISISASGFRITFDDLLRTVSNITLIAGRTTNSANSVEILVRSVSLDNSVLNFYGNPFRVKGTMLLGEILDDSILSAEMTGDAGTINAVGKLKGMDVTLKELDIGKLSGLKERIVLSHARAKLEKASDTLYRFHGEKADLFLLDYLASAASSFSGSFDLNRSELEIGGFELQSGKTLVHVDSFRTSTIRPDLEIGISDIRADLSDWLPGSSGSATGTAGVRSDTNLRISGLLEITNAGFMMIRQVSGTIRLTNNSLTADLDGKCFGSPFNAKVYGPDLFGGPAQLNLSLDQLDLGQVTNAFARSRTVTNQGGFVLPYVVNGQVAVGKIVFGKMQTGKTDLKFVISSSGIRVNDAQAEILKGRLQVKGDFADSVFTGDAVLSDAKLKEFTAMFLDSGKKLFGTVSGRGTFKLDTADPYRSSGEFNLLVRDGEIKDVFIQNRVSAVLFDIPLDDIFFDSIELDGNLWDGTVDVKKFRFNSGNIRLGASGQLGLRKQDLSFRAEIDFDREYLSALPNVAQIFTSGYDRDGRIAFGIAVNGPLKNPSVRIEKTK